MDFQIVIVAVIIIAALAYVGQTIWRKSKAFSSKSASSCDKDCGCGK